MTPTPPGAATATARTQRRIIKGSAWVLIGRVLSMGLGVAVNGFLARMLGKDAMGGYFAATSIVIVGSTVSNLGLNRTIVRLVAGSMGTGETGRTRSVVRLTFGMGAISALLVGTLITLGPGRDLALDLFDSQALADAMPFVAGWLVTMALQVLVAETFRGFKDFRLATVFSGVFVDIFSVAVFGGLWLMDANPSLSEIIMITVGLTGVSALVGCWMLRPKIPRSGPGTASREEILRISLPLLVFSMSSFIVGTGVDLWVVGAFEPIAQVALYGAASRLMFIAQMPFYVVSQVVPPIVAQLHDQGRREEMEHALRRTTTLAAAPALVALGFLIIGGGWLLALIYGGDFYRGAATTLSILGLARLVDVSTGMSGIALAMTGHQQVLMRITLVSAALSLGLGLLFVQPFGIVGVASATCIAQIAQNTMQLIAARRTLGIWTYAEFSLEPFRELLRTRSIR